MSAGVQLSDATTKRCKVVKLGAKTFDIVLTQGLNRQIRRMCDALGYTVVALQRVRIMHIRLENLVVGRWRNLTSDEVARLWPAKPRPKQAPQPARPARPAPPPPRHRDRRRGRR
jgi:23S rRNA pseudouridine2604 synthase